MRPFCFLFCVLVCGVLCCAQSPSANTDEQAIRDLVARYMQARNAKDPEATRALFTPDADQLVSTGEWRRGVDNLIRGAMASSRNETGHSSIEIESVRFLDAGVGLADGRYRTTSADGSVRNMWTTLILKRTDAGWRIAAIRNMLPSAPATAH